MLSLVEVPAACSTEPAAHVDQAEHELRLEEEVNVPAAHGEHDRSVVEVPAALMNDPGAHDDLAMHGVALEPSLSHVLAEHVVFGMDPPAQYVPAGHGEHWGALVSVPGLACSVPAAQDPCGRHADWLLEFAYVFGAQALHSRSVVDEPSWLT